MAAHSVKTGEKKINKGGMLYLCATPIGNLKDITLRTLQCLGEVDVIAAESIERARKLLHHYEIKTPLISYRDSNRARKSKEILARIKKGEQVALISDAGLPLLSDPGGYLVVQAIEENIPFTVLPGPSAALTALLLAGFPAEKFVFWGFLSRKKKARAKELLCISREEKTVILYEAPHRLPATLQAMDEAFPQREIAACRELTKKFEEVKRGTPLSLLAYFQQTPPRGEFTLILAPVKEDIFPRENQDIGEEIREKTKTSLKEALQKHPPAQAVRQVTAISPYTRNEVYAIMLEIREEREGSP